MTDGTFEVYEWIALSSDVHPGREFKRAMEKCSSPFFEESPKITRDVSAYEEVFIELTQLHTRKNTTPLFCILGAQL